MTITRISSSQIKAAAIKTLFKNVVIFNNSGAPNSKVDVDSCKVGSDDGTYIFDTLTSKTVDMAASGAGGLDTGSEAANTWYYVWLIFNPSNGNAYGMFSASASSPTMPSGYTKKRLVGCVRNNASSNFLQFRQIDRTYMYTFTQTAVTGGTATSWTSVNLSSLVPTSLAWAVYLWHEGYAAGGDVNTISGVSADGSLYSTFVYVKYTGSVGDYITDSLAALYPLLTINPPTIYYQNGAVYAVSEVYIQGFELVI
jgi:hypothetical protein